MEIAFTHLSLDISKASYKGQSIELRKNINSEWEIWVNGRKVKAGPFETQGKARDHLASVINRMEGVRGPTIVCAGCKETIALIPGVKECKKCGAAIKRQPLIKPQPGSMKPKPKPFFPKKKGT